jgi:V8-like Glu-specific endopeptidase
MSKNFIFLIFFLISCHFRPQDTDIEPDEETKQASLINHLSNSTVVLLSVDDEGKLMSSCAGVFVAPQKILTAKHCLEPYLPYVKDDSSLKELEELLKVVTLSPEDQMIFKKIEIFKKDWSNKALTDIKIPVKLFNQTNEGSNNDTLNPYVASVIDTDPKNDLALLSLDNEVKHDYVSLPKNDVFLGQQIHVIGHPAALEYTYHQGFISGSRYQMFENNMLHYIQISSPVFNGNSGGGAFDKKGNLIGICSIFLNGVPEVSYFVHTNEIKEFISKHISAN